MKTYKDLDAFKKRVALSTDWADYFKLNGRMFTIYEYGGGMTDRSPCYVYFRNARTNDMVKVEYRLPSVQYVNGQKVEKGEYSLIAVDYYENHPLWR